MAQSKRGRKAIEGSVENSAALVVAATTAIETDGYDLANARLDSLYQAIEDSETDPKIILRNLTSVLRTKMALVKFKGQQTRGF
jgi:hypothetical protein